MISDNKQKKDSIKDFGEQFKYHSDVKDYWASEEMLKDIVNPFDLNLIKENLIKRQNKCEEELNKVSQRLANKSFIDRAPKNIVDQEKTNYSELKNDIQKITLITESL